MRELAQIVDSNIVGSLIVFDIAVSNGQIQIKLDRSDMKGFNASLVCLCECIGHDNALSDTSQLHNRPFLIERIAGEPLGLFKLECEGKPS